MPEVFIRDAVRTPVGKLGGASGKANAWTEMVSHGELLRAGCNEQMEYDPKNCTWLIQGILTKDSKLPYESQPWKLGLMSIGEGISER